MPTALDELRSATNPIHRSLETLPYAGAVLDGSLPRSTYTSFLRAVSSIHETFERLLVSSQDPTLRALAGNLTPRAEMANRDLAFLGASRFEVDAAALEAELFGQRLRRFSRDEPLALAGVAYVLEGSLLGGKRQAAELRQRAEFSAGGLEYLSGSGAEAGARFQRFTEALNALVCEPEPIRRAIRGAVGRACLDDARFFAAAQALEAQISSELGDSWRGCGLLPVAAVVDEACGIPGAVHSVETWLVQADQLGTSWAAAGRASIAAAKLQVSLGEVRSEKLGAG